MNTIKELRKAIKQVKEVCVQPRFGCAETWIKISKASALELISMYENDMSANDIEMYTGSFGEIRDCVLYIG